MGGRSGQWVASFSRGGGLHLLGGVVNGLHLGGRSGQWAAGVVNGLHLLGGVVNGWHVLAGVVNGWQEWSMGCIS